MNHIIFCNKKDSATSMLRSPLFQLDLAASKTTNSGTTTDPASKVKAVTVKVKKAVVNLVLHIQLSILPFSASLLNITTENRVVKSGTQKFFSFFCVQESIIRFRSLSCSSWTFYSFCSFLRKISPLFPSPCHHPFSIWMKSRSPPLLFRVWRHLSHRNG